MGNIRRDVAKLKEDMIVTRRKTGRQLFAPSAKNVKIPLDLQEVEIGVPDGIIAHLTKECGGNRHDRHVVNVTSGSFEKETLWFVAFLGFFLPRRMQLIWKLFHASLELIAAIGKIFPPHVTFGCSTISRRGGLWQCAAQSAQVGMVRAVVIRNRGSFRRRRTGSSGGMSPGRTITSSSTAIGLQAPLQLRAAEGAASSGWRTPVGITSGLTSF
jgi:hypothetical protein